MSFGFYYNPVVSSSSVYPTYPRTPAIDFLRNDSSIYRIMGVTCCVLPPNTAMMYGIQDFRIYDGLTLETYARFQQTALGGDGMDCSVNADLCNSKRWNLNLLGLANVKYILTQPGFNLGLEQGLAIQLYRGNDADIYLNLAAQPRAFVVFNVIAAKADQALSALQTIDPTKTAITDVPIDLMGHQETPAGKVTITQYGNMMVVLETNTNTRGFLVLSDMYFPGWQAYIDGKLAEILRADYAFRGVVVPSGRHVIEFVYDPISFRVGILSSIASLSASLILLMSQSMTTRRLAHKPVSEHLSLHTEPHAPVT